MNGSAVSGVTGAVRHTTTPAASRQGVTTITIGAGTHLVHFRDLYSRFAPFGYTESQFRKFLRALGCPCLVTPSGDAFVNLLAFQIAINAATRIGARDFYSPGASSNAKPSPHRTRTLSSDYVHSNFLELISELLCARKTDHALNTPAVRSAFHTAASRLAASLTRIAVAEHVRASHRARTFARSDGVLPPFPDCTPSIP